MESESPVYLNIVLNVEHQKNLKSLLDTEQDDWSNTLNMNLSDFNPKSESSCHPQTTVKKNLMSQRSVESNSSLHEW